jgi:diaminohydroxyphosphoribosylaminopyrimidine deaminase / 5-amino-6-(5-phosphoribosylamino)uracil reductase
VRYQTAPRSALCQPKEKAKVVNPLAEDFYGSKRYQRPLEPCLLISPFFHVLKDQETEIVSPEDDYFFALALQEASRTMGTTHPNPSVGAVLAQQGKILATGRTQAVGGMHAEKQAIHHAHADLCSATLYVTLEPCCHYGRTPPCTDAIIKAGIKRVVYGVVDPNPLVAGKGIKALEDVGIEVIQIKTPLYYAQALAMIKPFKKWVLAKRPYVVIKIATSHDNKIAQAQGLRTKITSHASDIVAHRLRRCLDAVMVGANTARIDDPELTVRLVPSSHQPTRIVLGSKQDLPQTLKLFDTRAAKTMLMSDTTDMPSLTRLGVHVITCSVSDDHLDLDDALTKLSALGFTSILIEAGRKLFNALVKKNLADEIWWFTTKNNLGPQGLDLGWTQQDIRQRGYTPLSAHKLDGDELVIYYLNRPEPFRY